MIKINRIGFNWSHGNSDFYINRPHGEYDYLFLLIRSKANVFLGGENLIVESPGVIIYSKGSEQKYSSADEVFINDWFHFDSDYIGNENEVDVLLKSLDISPQTLIYINDFQIISNLIQDLEYEFRQSGLYQKELIDAKIKTLLCKIACLCHQETKVSKSLNRHRVKFTNIRNYIYQYHGPNISIPHLAEQINMSTSYFQHTYKILFGISPTEDIIRSRIEYACILLRSENISIINICEKCNYSNIEHFTRQFRQYMKCSPSEYRNISTSLF